MEVGLEPESNSGTGWGKRGEVCVHWGLECAGSDRGVPHFEQLVLEQDQMADLEQVEDVRQPAVQVGQLDVTVARHFARNDATPQKHRTDRVAA